MDGCAPREKGLGMLEALFGLFSGKTGIFLGVIFALLSFASVAVHVILRHKSSKELKDRVNSWWIIVLAFVMGAMLNTTVAMFFFGLISYLALKEYFSLIPTRLTDRRIIFYAYIAIIFQYYFAAIEWYGMFIIWIPYFFSSFFPFVKCSSGIRKVF